MIRKENKYFIYDHPKNITWKYFIKKFLFSMEALYFKTLMKFIHPSNVSEKKNYKVSICAIFKDEAKYLKEWIEFHRVVGIDHFYMYNNFSSDNYKDILSPYIDEGIVDLIDWPVKQGQIKAYEDCISKYKDETKWIGFIDIDEFIVPKDEDSVYGCLEKFDNKCPAVIVYWKLFGSSGKINRNRNGLVCEDFTHCWKKYDEVGKCFYNTDYCYDSTKTHSSTIHHYMWGVYRDIELPPMNLHEKVCIRNGINPFRSKDFSMQINHYFTKSYKEYGEKKAKGDVYFEINPHDEAYFHRHDMLCQGTDYHIFKYMIQLKKRMKLDE